MTNFRVRALAITPNNKLLFIKRIKGNAAPYWIFVGGGVENTDANFVEALERELLEEANAKGEILYPVHYTEQEWEGKKRFDIYYLVHLHTWSEVGRMGEEFLNPENGLYLLDEVEIATIENITLYPEEVKSFLINNQSQLLHLPQISLSHIFLS